MKLPCLFLLILSFQGIAPVASAQTPATAGAALSSAPGTERQPVAQHPDDGGGRDSPKSGTSAPPLLSVAGDRVGKGTGVEMSALWPLYPGNLFQLRATIPVALQGRGQLLVGTQGHVPHSRSAEGRFSSLAGHIGFRTYLWKGLHIDAMANLGVGRLRGSVVDSKDYDSFDAELLATVGWRFEAGPVYALLQPLGIGAVVYRSNPWAIVGEGRRTTEPPIFIGNDVLGLQL